MGKGKEGDGKGRKGRTTCYEAIVNWTPPPSYENLAPRLLVLAIGVHLIKR